MPPRPAAASTRSRCERAPDAPIASADMATNVDLQQAASVIEIAAGDRYLDMSTVNR